VRRKKQFITLPLNTINQNRISSATRHNYSAWTRLTETEIPTVTNDTGQKIITPQNTGSGEGGERLPKVSVHFTVDSRAQTFPVWQKSRSGISGPSLKSRWVIHKVSYTPTYTDCNPRSNTLEPDRPQHYQPASPPHPKTPGPRKAPTISTPPPPPPRPYTRASILRLAQLSFKQRKNSATVSWMLLFHLLFF